MATEILVQVHSLWLDRRAGDAEEAVSEVWGLCCEEGIERTKIMGTRAAFWMGDPANLEQRQWLGCVAWDGYPSSFEDFAAYNEAGFKMAVMRLATERRDFAAPDKGWPFPWSDDVFLTDCTYAFFDGKVQYCYFHQSFMPLAQWIELDNSEEEREDPGDDPRHIKVPAPAAYNPEQPDSIMVVSFNAMEV